MVLDEAAGAFAAALASIEAVLMGYPRRVTLCISSQAGCALGCTFCATGQFGFERHLAAGEITAQVAYAAATLRAAPIPGRSTTTLRSRATRPWQRSCPRQRRTT